MAGIILIALFPIYIRDRDSGLPSEGRQEPSCRKEDPSITDPAAASVKRLLVAATIGRVHNCCPAVPGRDDIVLKSDYVVTVALTIRCGIEIEKIKR